MNAYEKLAREADLYDGEIIDLLEAALLMQQACLALEGILHAMQDETRPSYIEARDKAWRTLSAIDPQAFGKYRTTARAKAIMDTAK